MNHEMWTRMDQGATELSCVDCTICNSGDVCTDKCSAGRNLIFLDTRWVCCGSRCSRPNPTSIPLSNWHVSHLHYGNVAPSHDSIVASSEGLFVAGDVDDGRQVGKSQLSHHTSYLGEIGHTLLRCGQEVGWPKGGWWRLSG